MSSVPHTDPRTAFLAAATWHGDLAPAEALLARHPEIAGRGAAIVPTQAGRTPGREESRVFAVEHSNHTAKSRRAAIVPTQAGRTPGREESRVFAVTDPGVTGRVGSRLRG